MSNHLNLFQDTSGISIFSSNSLNILDKSLYYNYWNDINLKPSFCNICFSANFNDIINKPNSNSLSTLSNLYYSSNSFNSSFSNINYSTSNNLIIFNNNKLNNLNSSLWITSNSNIYSNLGSIGIGTSSFGNNKLSIKGNLKADEFKIKGTNISNIIITSNTFDNKSNNLYNSVSNLDYNSKNKQITSSQFTTDSNKNLFINYLSNYSQYSNLITSTCNSLILSQKSQITINYSNQFLINSGTYNIIFNNGSIIFGSLNPDKSYPILKDISGNNINPTAWYKFDDTTNLGKDEMNVYNLINYNSVAYNSTNFIKGTGSSSFNSANSRYLLGSAVNINNKSFSISFWVYPTNLNNTFIYSKLNGSPGSRTALHIGYRTSTNFTFAFWGDDLEISVSNHLNNWNFFTLTYNMSNNEQKAYINSVFITSRITGGSLNSSDQNYNIGRSFGGSDYFSGLLDDFRIYSGIVLTQTQINELYNGRVNIFS